MHRRTSWAVGFVLWTLLGVSYTLAYMGRARLIDEPMTWAVAFGWFLPFCYLWMVLAAIPIALARWVGFEARAWRRAIAVHLPAALGLALVHHAVFITLYWQLGSPLLIRGTPLAKALQVSMPWRVHDGVVVYALVLLSLYVLHYARRRAELESRLASSQLEALRMQLQPHFLFNTLTAISALVEADPAQAKTMIARLGDFLRLVLERSERSEVPLRQELLFVERYLAIQRVRFQDRLTVHVEAAPDVLDVLVPPLVLQPLIENALHHGISDRPGVHALGVRSRREGDVLVMEVEDDGDGLPAVMSEGVGLRNTRARLSTRYGGAARLDLTSRSGGGVVARVSLPIEAGR
jgi:two-component system, LytTR family, sensor kinase